MLAQPYHVVIPDNAGIGATRALPAPLSIDAMARQTSALISTLGLQQPDVLGWSMGSMIAQVLTVMHPTRCAAWSCARAGQATARPSGLPRQRQARSAAGTRRR